MKHTYFRPTPQSTIDFADEDDLYCAMDFIPPFTVYTGYNRCSRVPGFPSGHTSLLIGLTFGCLVPAVQMLLWYLQYCKNNKQEKDFRILFVQITMIILLTITTAVVLCNLIPALMYARGHYASDIYTSALLSIIYVCIGILLHPGQFQDTVSLLDDEKDDSIQALLDSTTEDFLT